MNTTSAWLRAAAVAAAIGFGPVSAQASPGTIITGTFNGTMISGEGDGGVFGTAGADLAGQLVSGTFSYDVDKLSVSANGTATDASNGGAGGAISVTLSLGGLSFTFSDQTSGDIHIGSNGVDQFTLGIATSLYSDDAIINETVFLDFYDPTTRFLAGVGLNQTFTATPMLSDATFSILDIDSSGQITSAGGAFSIGRASLVGVPEPNTAVLLASGVLGVVGLAALRRRTGVGALRG